MRPFAQSTVREHLTLCTFDRLVVVVDPPIISGITGEGAQCDDLAEGNELIKSLQAKSAISKDRYFQETLDKYNDHNFKGEAALH